MAFPGWWDELIQHGSNPSPSRSVAAACLSSINLLDLLMLVNSAYESLSELLCQRFWRLRPCLGRHMCLLCLILFLKIGHLGVFTL